MIKPYIYVPHPLQNFHEDITTFMLDILKNKISAYDRQTLPGKLKDIFKKKGTTLEKYLDDMFVEFGRLSAHEKLELSNIIVNNNCIEDLCANRKPATLYTSVLPNGISDWLNDFYHFLWEDAYDYEGVKQEYGTLKDHHEEFKKKQKIKVCPLCGILPIKPPGSKAREAYDHYLAKSLYPFNTINMYNLVPTCHECNSDEKGAEDVLVKQDGTRSKAFYPYSVEVYRLHLSYDIHPYANTGIFISKKKWKSKILCNNAIDERVATWMKVYGIENRYHNYTCYTETVWLKAIVDNYRIEKRKGTSFETFKTDYLSQFESILSNPLDILENAYAEYLLCLDGIKETLDLFLNNGIPEP